MMRWQDGRIFAGAVAAQPALSDDELILLVALKGFTTAMPPMEIGRLDDAPRWG